MIINCLKVRFEYLEKVTRTKIRSRNISFKKGNIDFCRTFYQYLSIYSTIHIVTDGGELGDADVDLTEILGETFDELEQFILKKDLSPAERTTYWQGAFKASQNAVQIVELAYQELISA